VVARELGVRRSMNMGPLLSKGFSFILGNCMFWVLFQKRPIDMSSVAEVIPHWQATISVVLIEQCSLTPTTAAVNSTSILVEALKCYNAYSKLRLKVLIRMSRYL